MENSKFITKTIGKFKISMYETEFGGCNPFYGVKYCKSKIGNKVYDTSKSNYCATFKCEYGEFNLYKVVSRKYWDNYFVEYENNDERYIFPCTKGLFDVLREEFDMSNNDCIALINKVITEEFKDLDIIFDENKADEITFFNVNTNEMYEAYFNCYGSLIFYQKLEYGNNYKLHIPKDYESIKSSIKEFCSI